MVHASHGRGRGAPRPACDAAATRGRPPHGLRPADRLERLGRRHCPRMWMDVMEAIKNVFADARKSQRQAVLDKLLDGHIVDASAVARAEVVAASTNQPIGLVLNQLGSA